VTRPPHESCAGPFAFSHNAEWSSFAIATALDVCKPALANACFACSCFCTRFALPVRIFPTVVLPSAIRISSSARERRNRRRSRDRDKRAPTSGCIVVQAEPLRSPRPVRPARRASPPGCSRAGLPLFPTRNEANDSRRNITSSARCVIVFRVRSQQMTEVPLANTTTLSRHSSGRTGGVSRRNT
jgi:hypothetical protein